MTNYPIPDRALDECMLVVGKRNSGKTYATKTAVERKLAAGERVVIVDPLGVWHGLRSSADGRKPGFPIVIFGGAHADVQINEKTGEALGELIGTVSFSCIVDLRSREEFPTKASRRRFMLAFLTSLHKHNNAPLCLVLDEGDLWAKQRPIHPEDVMLTDAVDEIARRGRTDGFYVWAITQRPAVISKDVLSQCDTLIAMRLIAPRDRAAVKEWIEGQADGQRASEVLGSLPKLPQGEGWVWYPEGDLLTRVKFPKLQTFDSSRSPKGRSNAAPARAAVDLDQIRTKLATIQAEVAENDPKALKARIAELERQLAQRAPTVDPQAIADAEQRGYLKGYEHGARTTGYKIRGIAREFGVRIDQLSTQVRMLEKQCADLASYVEAPDDTPAQTARNHSDPVLAAGIGNPQLRISLAPPAGAKQADPGGGSGDKIPAAARAMLAVLVQRYPKGCTRSQLGILSGYSPSSGHFDNMLAWLRKHGLAAGSNPITATEDGVRRVGHVEPLPAPGRQLIDYWLSKLGKAERAMLTALVQAYPRSLTREELGEASGYSPSSGHFDNTLGRLRTLELVTGGRGAPLKAADALFGE